MASVPDEAESTTSTPKRQMKKGGPGYPDPFIVQPTGPHTHTMIVLHGRGSNGPEFGGRLLRAVLSSQKTLAQEFPGMRFVFPSASPRRAAIWNRSIINQWMDH